MLTLSNLKNTCREKKRRKLLGRGPGSGRGKTCGRGHKGMGSRSGYKHRYGYEGGQFRTFMKIPQRGFSNAPFRVEYHTINLGQIAALYEDGEIVNLDTLVEKGYLSGQTFGIKVLAGGELNIKVTIEADAISESAKAKLQQASIQFTIVG